MIVQLESEHSTLPYELDQHDRRKTRISITKLQPDCVEFDLVHCDTALANALRRMLIAEVPTVAVEKVLLYDNDSPIPDEVLCHRLGLVPLAIDPRLLTDCKKLNETDQLGDLHAKSTVVFDLEARCTNTTTNNTRSNNNSSNNNNNNNTSSSSSSNNTNSADTSRVYSSQMKWIPLKNQEALFHSARPRPVHDDILLCRLPPNGCVHARLLCVRGIGRDHAKFSPVCTASYRLLSDIQLQGTIKGQLAESLRDCFPPGVVQLDSSGRAFVADVRKDNCSREVLRNPHLAELVKIGLVRDHFLFSVESVGCLPAVELVQFALQLMADKCDALLAALP